MRWSEFAEKELIDIRNGERIGTASHADLVLDEKTGKIRAMSVPVGPRWFGRKQGEVEITWDQIKKVGPEMVLVDSVRKGPFIK